VGSGPTAHLWETLHKFGLVGLCLLVDGGQVSKALDLEVVKARRATKVFCGWSNTRMCVEHQFHEFLECKWEGGECSGCRAGDRLEIGLVREHVPMTICDRCRVVVARVDDVRKRVDIAPDLRLHAAPLGEQRMLQSSSTASA
jgi:hypothetical protein